MTLSALEHRCILTLTWPIRSSGRQPARATLGSAIARITESYRRSISAIGNVTLPIQREAPSNSALKLLNGRKVARGLRPLLHL